MFNEKAKEVFNAIHATSEICGKSLSEGSVALLLEDLAPYPYQQVLGALKRCRRELKGVLTLHDIVSRLDDGRPGVEEAFAMLPRDEATSCVMTDEMAAAMGVCQPLFDAGDDVAARMAFKEVYLKAIIAAREEGKPVRWFPSLGHDRHGRYSVLLAAVQLGRLNREQAAGLLSYEDAEQLDAALDQKPLALPGQAQREQLKATKTLLSGVIKS